MAFPTCGHRAKHSTDRPPSSSKNWQGGCFHHPHFTDEKAEAQKAKRLAPESASKWQSRDGAQADWLPLLSVRVPSTAHPAWLESCLAPNTDLLNKGFSPKAS